MLCLTHKYIWKTTKIILQLGLWEKENDTELCAQSGKNNPTLTVKVTLTFCFLESTLTNEINLEHVCLNLKLYQDCLKVYNITISHEY